MNHSLSSSGSGKFPTFARLFAGAHSRRFPTFVRLFHWLFNWRRLGQVLVGLSALATLIGLFYAEENWRGKHAWEKYKQELEAKGAKLNWKDYVPPTVPDDQNFAMTPFLAPLLDFNPVARPEGQSIFRDTNGVDRAQSFAREIRVPDPDTWLAGRLTDLPALALALRAKTNAAPPATRSGLTRSEAAAQVLRSMERFQPVLDELRAASRRPYARFNILYDFPSAPAILVPHLPFLRGGAQVFLVRASAELALGRADEAWADTQMALYLADTVKQEPFIVSKLVRKNIVELSLQPIWEGLAEQKWPDARLVEMQERLGKIVLLTPEAMKGEEAFGILSIDQVRATGRGVEGEDLRLMPAGWFYRNQLIYTRIYQDLVLPVMDGPAQRVYPTRALANEAIAAKELASGFRPGKFLARYLLIPEGNRELVEIIGSAKAFALGQTRLNEAIVACALERYRQARGQFPDTLDAISPRFLEKIPHDIITGEPLKYRRTSNGQFILYSVGWDEKDDGGTVVLTQRDQNAGVESAHGDWVWRYPAR